MEGRACPPRRSGGPAGADRRGPEKPSRRSADGRSRSSGMAATGPSRAGSAETRPGQTAYRCGITSSRGRIRRSTGWRAGVRSPRPRRSLPRPHRSVKSTRGVDSHFDPPAIHTSITAYPQARPTSCGTAAGCAVAYRRQVPWRERPPAPRAWCGIAPSVFSHPRPPASTGRSSTRDPSGKGVGLFIHVNPKTVSASRASEWGIAYSPRPCGETGCWIRVRRPVRQRGLVRTLNRCCSLSMSER